ncbi:MAG: GvpL/GvpF family gas vesicle protein [Bacteroidota bacterium]
MAPKGIYIYGIVPNFYGTTHFQSLEHSGVYAITYENISAIVSDREGVQLDYLDRESLGYLLVHHQETIEILMGKGFSMIIPLRLGTIAGSKDEVINILAKGHDLIIDTLRKIEYLTEIDLAVTWADFAVTIKEIASHPEIAALRDAILKNSEQLTQADQMKVGMLIQEKLTEKNKQVELRILEALSSCCIHVKMHDVMNDQMVTNSAFLMNRNQKEKFEQIIDQLDEELNGLMNFKMVGPLPCYSFYTLEVKELNLEKLMLAKIELGLREETSESEIKKAYLEKARLSHPDTNQHEGDDELFNRINKAYHTMLEYASAVRQSSKDDSITLAKEKMIENLILVKIKE